MKRAPEKKTRKSPRWDKEPAPVPIKEVYSTIAVVRELLKDVAGTAARLRELGIDPPVIEGGNAAYERAEGAVRAMANGLKAVLIAHIRSTPPEMQDLATTQPDESIALAARQEPPRPNDQNIDPPTSNAQTAPFSQRTSRKPGDGSR
jgi:hypothetical protein